jgi:hypothetical protein
VSISLIATLGCARYSGERFRGRVVDLPDTSVAEFQ